MEQQRSQLEAIGELAHILSELGDTASLPPADHLSQLVSAIHPSDLADLVSAAPEHVRLPLFHSIPDDEVAAEVLALVDGGVREGLLEELSVEKTAALVSELAHDDAADVLAELSPPEQEKVLAELDAEEAAGLRELAAHHPASAGGLMNDEFIAVQSQQTVRQALMQVKTAEEDWEDITQVFVVDSEKRLVGVADLDDLLRADVSRPMHEVMESRPVFARVHEEAEEAAQRAAHYRLPLLPVVDASEVLVGVISYDDVMESLGEEASRDMYRLAGTLEQNPSREGLFDRLLARFPFLLVTIAGTYLVAVVIRAFLGDGESFDILRFIPMIAALAGNAGIQASTTMIRGFATGDIQASDFRWLLTRELGLSVLMGVAAALVEFLLLLVGQEPADLLFVVPTAQALSVVLATVMGVVIPFLCWRVRISFRGRTVRIDPALAAGPFITTLNDILSTTVAMALAVNVSPLS